MPSPSHLLSPALAVALIALFPLAAQAQFTWDATTGNTTIEDGAGTWDTTTATWFDGTNYDQLYTPGETSTVTIGSGGAGGTVNISNGGSPIAVGNLTFGATTSAYTITGDGLDFTTAVATVRTITFNSNVVFNTPLTKAGGNENLTLSAGGGTNRDITFSADSGTTLTNQVNLGNEVWMRLNHESGAGDSGNININGTDARLILGGTQVAGGSSFEVSKNIIVGNSGANKIIQMTGGTTNTATLSGTLTISETASRNFDVSPNGTDAVDQPGQILTLSGKITGNGMASTEDAINVTGNGVVELAYDAGRTDSGNDFRGQVRLHTENAVLKLSDARALPSPDTGANTANVVMGHTSRIELADGVSTHSGNQLTIGTTGNNKLLRVSGTTAGHSATWGGNIVVNETTDSAFDLRADDDQTLTIEGVISGGGGAGINTINDGTIVLNGNNNFTGGAHLGDGGSSLFNGTSGNKHGFTVIGHDNALGTAKAISRGSQIQAGTTGINIGNAIDINSGGLRLGGTQSFEMSGLITLVGSGNRGIGNYSSAAGVDITLSGGIVNNAAQNVIFQSTSNGNQGGGFIVSGDISGAGNVQIDATMGAGVVELSGTNTYTGNTIVNNAGGGLDMTGGELLFDIEANGTNNSVFGTGKAIFDGTFRFDLATADITDGNSWNIVDVATLTETFDTNFAVTSTAGAFSDLGLTHQLTDGNNTWTFTESTGDLTLAVIPEPSTGTLIALAALGILRRRLRA